MKTKHHSGFSFQPSAGATLALLVLFATPRAPAQTGWGSALQFDGVDDYVFIGSTSLPTPWTAEFWVNRQDSPDSSALLLGDSQFALKLEQYNNTRRVGFTRYGVDDYSFNYTAPANAWVHLAFVSSNDTRLYVNGVLQDTNAYTIGLPLRQLAAGTNSSGFFDRLKGTIDEVRIWNVARTQAQIQDDMRYPLTGKEPGLVAYWKFDEGAGFTTADATSQGHTAFLSSGVAWAISTVPWYLPSVGTLPPTDRTPDGTNGMAILQGRVNPSGLPTTAWFEWGPTTDCALTTAATNLSGGTTAILLSHRLTGLVPGMPYYCRLVARNDPGTNYGSIIPFWSVPPSIGVNFLGRNGGDVALQWSEVAGVLPQPNWHNLPASEWAGFDGTVAGLADSQFLPTSVEFIYEANDAWNSAGGTGSPNEKLMKGIQKANPNPDTDEASAYAYFTFRNLQPGSTYNVIVYQAHNWGPARSATRIGNKTYYSEQATAFDGTFTRSTSTTPGVYAPGTDYVQFDNVTPDDNGIIEIEVKKQVVVPQLTDGIGIPGIQLVKVSGDWTLNAPVITAQPKDVLAAVGEAVTFSIGTDGPWTVEWFKNNAPMLTATGPSSACTFPTSTADKNASICAIVSNPSGSVTSVVATLTLDDPQPKQEIPGFLRVEHYGNVAGTDVEDLMYYDPRFPGRQFDYELFVPGGNVPQTNPNEDNFGRVVEGKVYIPAFLPYRLFIRSDDASRFYVSADPIADLLNAWLAALELDWGNAFQEPPALQTTDILNSTVLYIAAVYKEGGGDDYFQLAWRQEGDPTPANQLTPIGPENVSCWASPAGKRAWITDPKSVTVLENRTATFTVGVEIQGQNNLFAVQWFRKDVPIPGANGLSYTTGPVSTNDSGINGYWTKVYSLAGLLASFSATVIVEPDNAAPTALSAGIFGSGSILGVLFDEALDAATATNAANYTVAGRTVTRAQLLGADRRVVALTLSGTPTIGGNLQVIRVADLASNAIGTAVVPIEQSTLSPATLVNDLGGNPVQSGRALYLGGGDFYVEAGGSDLWNTRDAGYMVRQTWTGPFDLRVCVESLAGPDTWTKAAITVRESTASGARNVVLATTRTAGQNIHHFQWRNRANGDSEAIPEEQRLGPVPYPNAWLRLVRDSTKSNLIRSYLSTDGANWTPYFERLIPGALLPETVVLGMAATAHNNDAAAPQAEVLYRSFSITTPTPGVPPVITSITRNGSFLTIRWSNGGELESAATVYGPWTGTGDSDGEHSETLGPDREKFFRVKR